MAKTAFVIIDNDLVAADIQRVLLEKQGYEVQVSLDPASAVEFVTEARPDILLIDIMSPKVDGLDLLSRLRLAPELRGLKIIVMSSKSYPADRDLAFAAGADGMISKPPDPATFVDRVLALAADNIDITYWGLRATLPVPGRKSLRYGGNTTCVSLELPRDQFFIFDAGSGMAELSRHVMATRGGALSAKIFISHPHRDHIEALPLFGPFQVPGNDFDIMGPGEGTLSMREIVAAQRDGIYAPLPMRPFAAQLRYRTLSEEEFLIGNVRISTLFLNHPGNCLGYRIALGERIFCFVTDNELHRKGMPGHDPTFVQKLTDFVRDADILLTDVSYGDEQYERRVNWGHSGTGEVAALAHAAGVKEVQLMQHDPEQTDDDIDAKLAEMQAVLDRLESSTLCTAPADFSRRRMTAAGGLAELPPIPD